MLRKATTERLSALFRALLPLWPIWLSYAVSYLFIAIVWANHHHLPRYATEVTPRLMWFNFGHLFSVSLLPLATAWMAVSELASQPVACKHPTRLRRRDLDEDQSKIERCQ